MRFLSLWILNKTQQTIKIHGVTPVYRPFLKIFLKFTNTSSRYY
nr:MAG TPA: hypothetical protein [Caudoviricetes sp.]